MPKAKNLKYCRTKANMTQQEFADAIGANRSTIIAWESRKRAIPVPSAMKIASFFGVDYADFCDVDLSMDEIDMQLSYREYTQLQKFRSLSERSNTIFRAALDAAYKMDVEEKKD